MNEELILVHCHWANPGDDFDRYYPCQTIKEAAKLVLGILRAEIDAQGDPETYSQVSKLIESGDFKAAHEAWQDTFMLSASVPCYINVARVFMDGNGSEDITEFD